MAKDFYVVRAKMKPGFRDRGFLKAPLMNRVRSLSEARRMAKVLSNWYLSHESFDIREGFDCAVIWAHRGGSAYPRTGTPRKPKVIERVR